MSCFGFKFLFTSMTWVRLFTFRDFTFWIWNLAMYLSFMFVEFNFSMWEGYFLSVRSAILTWHSQWSHYCYIPQPMKVATWEDDLGSKVWKLESWRIHDKSPRLRARILAERTHHVLPSPDRVLLSASYSCGPFTVPD